MMGSARLSVTLTVLPCAHLVRKSHFLGKVDKVPPGLPSRQTRTHGFGVNKVWRGLEARQIHVRHVAELLCSLVGLSFSLSFSSCGNITLGHSESFLLVGDV